MRVSPEPIAIANFAEVRVGVRRALVLRVALGAAALALFALAFLESRGAGSEVGALLPAGTSPVVVLDISASISGPTNKRVDATLRVLESSKGTAGLVVFSDSAYTVFPPGTPTRELHAVRRYFQPSGREGDLPRFPPNPWASAFRSGTRIPAGLAEARAALARAGVRNGSVILVSDLDDPEDPAILASELTALRKAGITIKVVPLFPQPDNLAKWQALVGAAAIEGAPDLPPGAAARPQRAAEHPFRPGVPALLIALSALLMLVLAANERWCGRLMLGRETS